MSEQKRPHLPIGYWLKKADELLTARIDEVQRPMAFHEPSGRFSTRYTKCQPHLDRKSLSCLVLLPTLDDWDRRLTCSSIVG